MMNPEQEGIFQRARLRRERIAVLRRRREISALERQIDFETMWADPRRRAAYDQRRRLFYQHRSHLYEPVPKPLGRRALLANLGALLAGKALARAPDLPSSNQSQARLDVRNFGTDSHPFRGGSDDAVPIQAAINHAVSIGGAMIYLGPGPISLTGSQGIERPALSWSAPGIVLQGDGPGGTVITVRYNPSTDVISLGSVTENLNASHGGIRDLGIGLGVDQSQSAGAAIQIDDAVLHRAMEIVEQRAVGADLDAIDVAQRADDRV